MNSRKEHKCHIRWKAALKCPGIPEVQKSFWCSFNYVPLLLPLENIQIALVDRISLKICTTFGWKHTSRERRGMARESRGACVCESVLIFLLLIRINCPHRHILPLLINLGLGFHFSVKRKVSLECVCFIFV